MAFQNLQRGPILKMIALNFVIGVVIIFALYMMFAMTRMWDALSSMDPNLSQQEQEDLLRKESDAIMEEAQQGSPALDRLSIIQWALIGLVTFGTGWRAASVNAASPDQGPAYGGLIGIGTALVFLVCACTSTANLTIQFLFLIIIAIAGTLGGYIGGQNPRRPKEKPVYSQPAVYDPVSRFGTPTAASSMVPPGSKPETYYSMGVQAALGGRREEARQHFTRVLQIQPRSIAAWLQLANLADTPEQAWNYVQQARSINPTDPAVLHAVDQIWPKVAAQAAQNPPPQAQPPYRGGAMDDVEIPRSRLPGSTPAAPASGEIPGSGEPDDSTPPA